MSEKWPGESVSRQFNQLIEELLDGGPSRSHFRPWEIDILLDIHGCFRNRRVEGHTLRGYQKAAQRHLRKGAHLPLKLSEYVALLKERKKSRQGQALAQGAAAGIPDMSGISL